MKNIYRKCMNQKGETLVEVLASILVCVLSVTLLMNGVAISTKINQSADQQDEKFYQSLSVAERKQGTPIQKGKAIIKEGARTIKIPVSLYGGEEMYSYEES